MPALEWEDSLNVGVAVIDHDHRSSVDLMNRMAEAGAEEFPAVFSQYVRHLHEHFGREEALMVKCRFFAYGPHKGEHGRVLAHVDDLKAQLDAGDPEPARTYAREEAIGWFLAHREGMDLFTAEVVRRWEAVRGETATVE